MADPSDLGHGKNPAYGRQRISRPMRIVGPIQFWRGCVIFKRLRNFSQKKEEEKKGQPRENPGQTPGKPRDNPGKTLGKPQENPGQTTGKPQENPGTPPGKPRENPGKTVRKPRKPPGKPRENPGGGAEGMGGWGGSTNERPASDHVT